MFIDIHVHTHRSPSLPDGGKQVFCSPEQLIQRYDEVGIERAVLLPVTPRFQLPQTNEDAVEISRRWPGRFILFCNLDPAAMQEHPGDALGDLLASYKEQGFRGFGEVKPSEDLSFDHPLMQNLLRQCEALSWPLTFHLSATPDGGGLYDEPGLPILERALEKFPGVIFMGHSQPFWAEIGPLETPEIRSGLPKGPIAREGALPRLMRQYPNLHGDFSAGSGYNAVTRDLAFAAEFLEEFQDRLYFGTDICAPHTRYTRTRLIDTLKEMRDRGRISQACYDKVARENAVRLLGMEEG